ncbi:rRNA pseudouridine synthase [Pikeienuella piscinae]|uniref:Pseudouridine synthase n=1 Tax=Pikeienuella piscinae TaxID=2748098 RepID=A0A7L5BV94_9RHOB|nr:pseudouridine synthase [Pikeienuella piscinae]QIE54096.1 rRNA pseudouridine synthase [Pikeienuella piscinae]
MQQDDDNTSERIAKRLARAGVASRREAERMIEAGRVRVNGERIDSPALNVTLSDRIEVDGAPLAAAEPPRLWRYHKPVGLVTTARDEKGRATVFEKLPEDLPRVMSVGRLDINSEGLLLLTNDGELKRRLELPSTGWTRRYRARAHGRIDEAGLEPLRRGITIEGERFQPMVVSVERVQGGNLWLSLALKEGRNREIRRALEAVGLAVNRLIRVSYGPFQLGDLAAGGVEEVKWKILRDQLGLKRDPDTLRGPAAKTPEPDVETKRGRKPGARSDAKPGRDGGAKRPPGAGRGPKPGGETGGKSGARPASRRGSPRGAPRGSRRG